MTNNLLYRELLWQATSIFLLIIIILSLLVYKNNRDKIYLLYASYNFFILLYVFSLSTHLFDFQTTFINSRYYGFNWLVQSIYHYIHIIFGIYYLSINKEFPILSKRIILASRIELSLCFLIVLFEIILGITRAKLFQPFFINAHLLFYITIAVIVLKKCFYKPNLIKKVFFIGSLFYAIFAILAITTTRFKIYGLYFTPIMYFYIGVILEVSLFAYGLGLRIKKVYLEKLNFERETNQLQKELQLQLEKQLILQQRENEWLIAENEKERLKSENYVLQNRVLKNQMNSHFTFNVINSIKANVIEKEKREAVDYINLFAKFIRKSFEAGFKDEVAILEEIKTIQLYLEVEQRRLQDSFTFKIEIDPYPNYNFFKIPSFLLQPFVENAIWHGIMKSSELGKLSIKLKVIDSQTLLITIDDNGIGIESNPTKNHTSKGLAIVNDRIALFNNSNPNNKISYQLINKNKISSAAGVKVEILITKK